MGNQMGNLASKSFKFDTFGKTEKDISFYNIPSIILRSNSKGFPVYDSPRSPTTPLDFGALNSTNSSSFKSSQSSAQNGSQMKGGHAKAGLGLVISLVGETKSSCEVPGSLKSKNLVFGALGPLVKIIYPNASSNSNISYASTLNASSLPGSNVNSQHSCDWDSSNYVFRVKGLPLESDRRLGKVVQDPTVLLFSPANITDGSSSSSIKFYLRNRDTAMNPPLVIRDASSLDNNSKGIQSGSFPKPLRSNTASEISLCEEYTSIIFHGPNPKITHIYGDYILECHPKDLSNFVSKEEEVTSLPQAGRHLQGTTQYTLAEFLSFCHYCGRKIKEGKDIYMLRGDMPFCSLECRNEEILADEENEETRNNSSESSPESNGQETIFTLGTMDSI